MCERERGSMKGLWWDGVSEFCWVGVGSMVMCMVMGRRKRRRREEKEGV